MFGLSEIVSFFVMTTYLFIDWKEWYGNAKAIPHIKFVSPHFSSSLPNVHVNVEKKSFM